MIKKIESFLLEKFAGKLLARGAVTLAAYLASAPIQTLLAKAGLSVHVDPAEFAAGAIAASHAGFEWYKNWRLKADAAKSDANSASIH